MIRAGAPLPQDLPRTPPLIPHAPFVPFRCPPYRRELEKRMIYAEDQLKEYKKSLVIKDISIMCVKP